MSDKTDLFIRGIPIPVRDMFKARCAGRGDNMSEVIESLMRLYLDKPQAISDILPAVKKRRRAGNKRGGRKPKETTV